MGLYFIMAEQVELQSRCAFYLAAKRRNCKMLVVQGSKYCGQHIAMVSKNINIVCLEDLFQCFFAFRKKIIRGSVFRVHWTPSSKLYTQ